jgi:hypothetical protein
MMMVTWKYDVYNEGREKKYFSSNISMVTGHLFFLLYVLHNYSLYTTIVWFSSSSKKCMTPFSACFEIITHNVYFREKKNHLFSDFSVHHWLWLMLPTAQKVDVNTAEFFYSLTRQSFKCKCLLLRLSLSICRNFQQVFLSSTVWQYECAATSC